MIGENDLQKSNEKKMDKKILIGIIIAVVLLIAIVVIIMLPKKSQVGEIILSENINSIYISEKREIDAVVRNYNDAILNYKSSDENVIKFDNNIMEGLSVGKSKITISCNIEGIEPLIFDVNVVDGGGIINESNFPKGELVIGVNKEYNLKDDLIINPSNGKINSITFVSSNTGIASINELGILKTNRTGMTNITTRVNNRFTSTITVFVVDKDVPGEIITNADKIIFKEDTIKINVDDVKTIEYDVYPADSSMEYVTISCSDPKTVSLEEDGNVRGLKTGKANIVYKTIDNKEYKLSVEVVDNIIDVEEIKVSQDDISMNLNTTKEVPVSVIPSTAKNKDLHIIVSDTKIVSADINNNSLIIKSINVGSTTIILESSNGIKKTIKVSVNNKKEETPKPTVTPTATTTPYIEEREITNKDYENRGYSISTTTGNLNRTYDVSIQDGVFYNSSVITFTSKEDNLNIWVCDYLFNEDKCDVSKGVNLKDKVNTYEINGYGMHVIAVYEEGKVLIPYYIYLQESGYTVNNLYLTKDEANKNSVKNQAVISFNITNDKVSKLKVCWTDATKDCNPLTEINTVKPITKINNKLYLNNPNLWKVKVIELDNNDKSLRDADVFYVNVTK